MLAFLMTVWTLLFVDGTRQTVHYDPANRAKPERLYAYVRGDGSTMVFTPDGWDTTERDTGTTEAPP